jgi:hypothetical protein
MITPRLVCTLRISPLRGCDHHDMTLACVADVRTRTVIYLRRREPTRADCRSLLSPMQ